MLLKCTADGRRIKVNCSSAHQGSAARAIGMKMTMSTTATMSARVQRKVMRAPHKRTHTGKLASHPGKIAHPGKMAAHPGKIVSHLGKIATHSGKIVHPGKLAHLGRFGKLQHYTHTAHALRPPEPCGDSNDSGLGPDQDPRHAAGRLSEHSEPSDDWRESEPPRHCQNETDVKLECDDAIDEFTFVAAPPLLPPVAAHNLIRASSSISSPGKMPESPGKRFQDYRSCGKLGSSGKLATKYAAGGKFIGAGGKLANGGKMGGKLGGKLGGKYSGKLAQALARRRALAVMHSGPPGLAAPLSSRSRDGTVELQILCQPETQHRARYQTEGSRGAVKDNSGNGFPIVKLLGYDKPAVLQVFIGTDTGRVAPHMFYQACRVSGKNSTPCKERKDDGTVIIEIDLEPSKNWQVTCDCVGILKERNVDVEHRFGESLSGASTAAHVSRGKKKSTRCRMVFRTEIVDADGHTETLQVCSTQIICTQPPGVPEVCRKSLVSCPTTGGLELYLLGKNFLKESRVVFSQRQDGRTLWEEEVMPDKEFLQQTHLVCCVPPYRNELSEPVCVQLFVRSGGRASEPHPFYYTPASMQDGPLHCTRHHTQGCEEPRTMLGWSLMPPPDREPLGLKSELHDDASQQSAHGDSSDGHQDDVKVVDLRLKSSPPQYYSEGASPPTASPLASFTQQLQAIQNQVQTDKMVETVTAALFNTAPPPPGLGSLETDMKALGSLETEMKALDTQLMRTAALQSAMEAHAAAFDPFSGMPTIDAMKMDTRNEDAAKLDELVNSRADDHLAGPLAGQTALPTDAQDMDTPQIMTPPATVKSMILTAAAEILTSDSAMNALVTSAINTANILTENEPPAEQPATEAPLAAAVSAAVTQAVSQAVSHAVSQAVTQEMSAPVQGLTDMSDSDLLSYINPSTFDQV